MPKSKFIRVASSPVGCLLPIVRLHHNEDRRTKGEGDIAGLRSPPPRARAPPTCSGILNF